jgi:alanyl-tRNA synthetase
MMLFGEKYGDEVRVLDIGSSRELCGGTHVARTGDIGLFKITAETGVAAGVRRIEATTGDSVLKIIYELQDGAELLAHSLGSNNVNMNDLAAKAGRIEAEKRELEKELGALKSKLASAAGNDLLARVKVINGVNVLAEKLDGADAKTLRDTLDQVKSKLGSAVILLAAVDGDKVMLIAGVTKDLTDRYKAGELLSKAAAVVGGKGGGRPDMAQGGGTNPAALPQALALAEQYITG